MKKISTYTLLIINTFFSIQCMKHNSHIGNIDKLMIMNAISQQGTDALEQAVNKHAETSYLGHLGGLVPMYEPFLLTYICLENDVSELSKKAFSLIEQKIKFNSKNPDNQQQAQTYHSNYIDECTCWRISVKNHNIIILNSLFFDTTTLIAIIKQLTPQ